MVNGRMVEIPAHHAHPPAQTAMEKRESGGDFYEAVLRFIDNTAVAGTAANVGSTAAMEAASGALSRAFASAEVQGSGWARDAITPDFLGQVGRDLVQSGDSMHAINMDAMSGRVVLLPCSSWHFEGDADPATWTVRATMYGPSTSTTRHLPFASVIFVKWGARPGQAYAGIAPTSWAHTTARLQSEVERSLADEAAGPIAQLLTYPSDPKGNSGEKDEKLLKAITAARGKAALLETTAHAHSDGRNAAPAKDWDPNRLGPNPPDAMEKIRQGAFASMLAACGVPPSLFLDADGTAQREAVRRWHQNLVRPMARMLEHELTRKLGEEVRLKFDTYALDMVSRAQVVDKLVKAGVDIGVAMSAVGLEDE